MKVLAIDPGSTSTKLGLFDDDKPIYKESLFHNVEELSRFSTSFEQKDLGHRRSSSFWPRTMSISRRLMQ